MIRTIRERYPESLTVMLTSHADFEYAQESIRLGCFDYLVQPAPPEEIERVLQRAMQYLYERNKRNQLYEVGRRMQTGAMELLDGVAMNLFSARKGGDTSLAGAAGTAGLSGGGRKARAAADAHI